MLLTGSSGSRKNALVNLTKEQELIILLTNEPKYQFLVKKPENAGIKYWNNPKAFIEHSAYMDDV